MPVPTLQTLLATTASTLFESTPFILAGTLLAGIAPRLGVWAVPLLGCGCAGGRPARSIPAAVATALAFGPAVAAARFAAAWVQFGSGSRPHGHQHPSFGADSTALLLPAAAAAVLGFASRSAALHAFPLTVALAAASVFAPCGFGALAFAVTLRHESPLLATCALIGGAFVALPRTFARSAGAHDGLAYAVGSIACAIAAAHHGSSLVNPRFAPALAVCAAMLMVLAYRHRGDRAAWLRAAPLVMFFACILTQPAPHYAATEASFQDAFAGERIDFSGVLVSARGQSELVRYAITCCRADAQAVSVALARRSNMPDGTWLHVSGVFRRDGPRYVVDGTLARIAPPADPFLYR